MSKINDVVQRAISDAAFRTQLRTDPAKALRGFSLSPEETRALTSGDPSKLVAFGVDRRMSKVFMMGDGDVHSSLSAGDVGISHAALETGGSISNAALASTGGSMNAALTTTGGNMNAALTPTGDGVHDALTSNAENPSDALISTTGREDLLTYAGGTTAGPEASLSSSGQVDSGAFIDAGSVSGPESLTSTGQADPGAFIDPGATSGDTSAIDTPSTQTPSGDEITDN